MHVLFGIKMYLQYLSPSSSSWKRIISSLYSRLKDTEDVVDLPPEIIEEIVSRLSVQCLCRFKCVSKPWRSLISDILMKRRHVLFTVLGLGGSPSRLCSLKLDDEQFLSDKEINGRHNVGGNLVELDFVSGDRRWLPLVYNSCHGLFLTQDPNGRAAVSLYNPLTKESKILPEVPVWRRRERPFAWRTMYGVGFDYSTNDYKVINLQDYQDGIMFSVYTLKTDSWRKIDYLYPYYTNQWEGIVVNGDVHWSAVNIEDESQVIVSFLIAEEEVREIALPPEVDGRRIELGGAFRNQLCTALSSDTETFNEFWIMKEFGVRESWTKMHVSIPYHRLTHSGFSTKTHDLMVFDTRSLVMYNFNDHTFWNLSIGDDIVKNDMIRAVSTYLETPVPSLRDQEQQQAQPLEGMAFSGKCPLCFSSYDLGDVVVFCCSSNHYYHADCFSFRWERIELKRKRNRCTCPLCRVEVPFGSHSFYLIEEEGLQIIPINDVPSPPPPLPSEARFPPNPLGQ